MNFKKGYKKSKGYTKICEIDKCTLKKLEFGIIELSGGETLDFYTEDKETAFIILCSFPLLQTTYPQGSTLLFATMF